jgi:hypothetical protein
VGYWVKTPCPSAALKSQVGQASGAASLAQASASRVPTGASLGAISEPPPGFVTALMYWKMSGRSVGSLSNRSEIWILGGQSWSGASLSKVMCGSSNLRGQVVLKYW